MQVKDPAELKALAQRIIDSGELGRSKTYAAIFEYLVDCSIAGKTPKEAAIAVDVLGRDANFDVGKDSIVRVHIYHLRNKLETYFAKHGHEKVRLEIPKGQYLITTRLEEAFTEAAGGAEKGRRPLAPWLAGLAALLLALNLIYLYAGGAGDPAEPHGEVRALAPWSPILDDNAPILLVVGDYFIFGELDESGNVARIVREFDINSPADLNTLFMLEPGAPRYYNLGLSYIPNGAASALMSVMPLLYDQRERLSIKMVSQLNASDLTGNHVIYVGYISGLGMLEELMFAASGLQVGATYDELRRRDNGARFLSQSAIRNTGSEFSDYGMISTFPSPRGHQLVLIAGMRDAGLINAAQEISNARSLRALLSIDRQEAGENGQKGEALMQYRAWEALYEVFGLDHTNFNASLVYADTLEAGRIWGGK